MGSGESSVYDYARRNFNSTLSDLVRFEGFDVQDAPEFEQWVLTERTRLRAYALQLLHQSYHARYAAIHTEVEQALSSVDYATLWRNGWAMTLAKIIALGVA